MYGFENKYPYTDFHEMNLDWVLTEIKKHEDSINDIYRILNEWVDSQKKLIDLYNAICAGKLPQELSNAIKAWIRDNFYDIVGDMTKMVFFGLTDDGHFCAYIPESWNDITFNTSGLDDFPAGVEYGHLILSY